MRVLPDRAAAGDDDAVEIVREGIRPDRRRRRGGTASGSRSSRSIPRRRTCSRHVHTIPPPLELIGDADVGILLDTWHVPDPAGSPRTSTGSVGVHVADRREPTRSHFDRVLPGEGVLELGAVLRALEDGGYDGWYDVEIFSDNGAFGDAFPDSLWDVEPAELARRARESLERVWESAVFGRPARGSLPAPVHAVLEDGSSGDTRWSRERRFDAVAIGERDQLARRRARCSAKAGWRVCVLERNDWLGGAIRTAEITEPGSSTRSSPRGTRSSPARPPTPQLKDELERARGRVPEHRAAHGDALPRRRSAFLTTSHEENVAELGAGWATHRRRGSCRTPTSRSACSRTELWSRDGLGLGAKALRRLGRRGLVEFAGQRADELPRLDGGDVRRRARARAVRAVGAPHGPRPDNASSGFMAQVIGVAIELGGMPVPRGGGVKLVDALAGIMRDAGGACETGRQVEPHRGRGRSRDRRHARATARRSRPRGPCSRTSTPQAALRRPARRRRGPAERGGPLPLRPRRDADPLCALRAASLAGRRAARRARRSSTSRRGSTASPAR